MDTEYKELDSIQSKPLPDQGHVSWIDTKVRSDRFIGAARLLKARGGPAYAVIQDPNITTVDGNSPITQDKTVLSINFSPNDPYLIQQGTHPLFEIVSIRDKVKADNPEMPEDELEKQIEEAQLERANELAEDYKNFPKLP